MVKLVKSTLNKVLDNTRRRSSLTEVQAFMSDAVRIVNDRPLTTLRSEPNDYSPLSPSCFLGQQLAPHTPLSAFHDSGDLRRDYIYNVDLAHRFWLSWVKGYLPTLQGRGKWRSVRENISSDQLVLVRGFEDICKRGRYRPRRIHAVHPQTRQGRDIVRRATVAVLKSPDNGKIEYILRDISIYFERHSLL